LRGAQATKQPASPRDLNHGLSFHPIFETLSRQCMLGHRNAPEQPIKNHRGSDHHETSGCSQNNGSGRIGGGRG
jgi:hypothetical protein